LWLLLPLISCGSEHSADEYYAEFSDDRLVEE
jgi:hypothetical protein